MTRERTTVFASSCILLTLPLLSLCTLIFNRIECYSFNFTYPDSSSSSSSSDTHLHLLATSTDAATRKRTTAPLAHAANIVSRSDIVRATTSMLRRLIVGKKKTEKERETSHSYVESF